MGISPTEFLSLYGSQSDRIGGASTASKAGIFLELWGQYGDRKSAAAQRCYMKRNVPSILYVSLAAMGERIPPPVPRGAPPPVIRSNFVPSTLPVEAVAYSVEGIAEGSFAWHPLVL